MSKKLTIRKQVDDQRRWIEEHGGSQTAYIQRYGSADAPNHYGNGGEAIWAADYNALQRLLARLN